MTTAILDTFPFPFSTREAQELRQALIRQYSTPVSIRRIVEDSDIDSSLLFFEQPAMDTWTDVLRNAAAAGLTRKLVQTVHNNTPPSAPSRALYATLLAGGELPRSGLSTPRGTSPFASSWDHVSKNEALLFPDDVSLTLGQTKVVVSALTKVLAYAPSVCKLTVMIPGDRAVGTAFRVAREHLLTNWHVLHSESGTRALQCTAEFRFEDSEDGTPLSPIALQCDVDSVHGDRADDWALIRCVGMADAWPIVAIDGAQRPSIGEMAFVIQHPLGERKRVGFVRNTIVQFDARTVHYLTDTQVGSSGSPVFDQRGQLIAIHHAGGQPQDISGRQPLQPNEGMRVGLVLEGLARMGRAMPT
jgi:hypothetical protein